METDDRISARMLREGSCWGNWDQSAVVEKCGKCFIQMRCKAFSIKSRQDPSYGRAGHDVDEMDPFRYLVKRFGQTMEVIEDHQPDVERYVLKTADDESVVSLSRCRKTGKVLVWVRESVDQKPEESGTRLMLSDLTDLYVAECLADIIAARMM